MPNRRTKDHPTLLMTSEPLLIKTSCLLSKNPNLKLQLHRQHLVIWLNANTPILAYVKKSADKATLIFSDAGRILAQTSKPIKAFKQNLPKQLVFNQQLVLSKLAENQIDYPALKEILTGFKNFSTFIKTTHKQKTPS